MRHHGGGYRTKLNTYRRLLGSDAHSYAAAEVEALRANLDATALSAPATDVPAA